MTDFASLGIKIDSSQAKTAAADLDKLVDSGKSAEGAAKKTGDAWSKSIKSIQGDTGEIVQLLRQLNTTQTAALTAMGSYAQALGKTATANATVAQATEATNAAIGATTGVTKSAGAQIDEYTRSLERMKQAQQSSSTAAKPIDLPGRGASGSRLPAETSALDEMARPAAAAGAIGKMAAAGLADADKAASSASKSIDDYVRKLELTAKTNGMSTREAKLYDLALQGASKSQLQAADSAIRMNDAYQRGVAIGEKIRTGFIAVAAAAGTAAVAAYAVANRIADSIAKYQDLADKTGESAANIASLQTASDLSGVSLDTVANASVRLTAALSKTDDESKLVAKGIKALGLNFDEFKQLTPAQQLDAVAKAMAGFADGSEKSAAAVAIFGKAGAELIPFLNDLAEGGERQIRLTDEQIKAADDHTKAQARLRSEITQVAQVFVAESIPALTDLTKAVKETVFDIFELGDGAGKLASNHGIAEFAQDAVKYLSYVIDAGDITARTFQLIGKNIAAMAAGASALLAGNLSGAIEIGKSFIEDAGKIVSRELTSTRAQRNFDERRANESQRKAEDRGFTPGQRRIDVSGLNTDKAKKGRDTAAQEAKAQLAFDLDEIRKAQDALSNTIANGEKLLEAKRAANLVTEADYWKQKRTFLIENDAAQEDSLQKEITRLQQEQLSGKAKIDNDRKILDAQAKLAKVRENAAANLAVLAIKEEDALDKIKLKFEEAQKAAQDYVDTIARQNERELAGVGQGSLQREIDSRISQREDQFRQRRDQLRDQLRRGDFGVGKASQEEFDKRLAIEKEAFEKSLKLDADYWAARKKQREDGLLGAKEAFANYADEAADAAKHMEENVGNALKGIEDQLVNLFTGKKVDAKGLLDSIASDLARSQIKENITGPLAKMLGEGLGGSTNAIGASSAAAATSALAGSAATATASLGVLASAASAAATALAGSSIGSSLSVFGTGSAFGNLDFGQFFAEGGYTGPGGKYQPAGIVHAGEGVLSQSEIHKLGGEAGFNRLRSIIRRGYADGGYVSRLMGSSSSTQTAGHISGTGGPAVIQNFTVGDVATLSTVRTAVQTSQRQSAAALQRSSRYGGVFA